MLQPMGSDPLVGWLKLHKINTDLAPTLRICIEKYAHQIKELKIEDLPDRDINIPDEEISKVQVAINNTRPQVFVDLADRGRLNILTTWKMNYDTIAKENDTREFLHICSCLATRIQVALFVDGAKCLYPGDLRDSIYPKQGSGRKSSKQAVQKKIIDLFQRIKHFSFATNVVGESEEEEHRRSLGRMGEYTVHRLLQFVVFMRFIKPHERIQCINNTLNILEKLFPKMEESQDGSTGGVRDRHSIIAFHTLALAEQIRSAIEENGTAALNDVNPLFVAVSTYLFRLGRARDAKVLCKVMVSLSRSRKPVNKIKLADELCHLGEAYFQIGEEKLGKAEERLGESFALLEKIKGKNDIDVLTAKQRHARILQNMKEYLMDEEKRVKVKVMLEDILEKMKTLFETPEEQQNLNIANAMHQLGRFYQDTSDYEKAQHLLEKSLEIRQTYWQRKFGTADVESVAYGLTNLARNYIISSSKDTKKTEELLEEALKIKEKRLAPTNESYQLGKYYLAAYYRIQGQNDLSEKTAEDIVTDTYRKKLEGLLQKGSNTSGKVNLKEVFPPEKIDI
ncbi:uncharacterized protein [Ptychodera flava]|uniref:uncharacterized protein n=1 Tax=Ptychodera flava TaxID=63121 RepID=UPI00396A3209